MPRSPRSELISPRELEEAAGRRLARCLLVSFLQLLQLLLLGGAIEALSDTPY